MTDYLTLFPGSSRGHLRFMAFAGAVLRQAADLITLAVSLQPGFSFATAEGVQLDAIASAVGLSREPGMTDGAFRQYLLAKLVLWTWDGTNETAADVLPEGVTVSDNGDGTVSVSPSGARVDLLPVPAGIRIET